MDRGNTATGVQDVVPILFIPKQCTKLEMNCEMSENVFIDLSITSPDTEGNETCIYSGFCNVKLIESCNINIYPAETVEVEKDSSNSSLFCDDINQLPVVLSDASTFPITPYKQSQVWMDPSRSPYVYNNYDTSSQQTYSVLESSGCITVQQHNTYITQNVYNYDRQKKNLGQDKLRKISDDFYQQVSPDNNYHEVSPEIFYEDDESESEMFLAQLSKKNKTNPDVSMRNFASVQGKNEALKQLMSTDIQSTSKQRKTILFLGEDSTSGQTIQNILYTDPMVKCSALEVDNEVVIEDASSPTPKKKKFQCDKCKQIFHQISEFRQHMVGNHTNFKILKDKNFVCYECGKKFSNKLKYQMHCLGHGDPDLECPKCQKVYASRNNLKIHMKIHNRKFPCPYCSRSYDTSESYKTHLKVHSKFVCLYDDCFFMANSASTLDDHHDDHIDYSVDGDHNNNDYNVDIGDDHVANYDHDRNDQNNDDLNYHNDGQDNAVDESSNTEIAKAFMDDLSEDFVQDLITTECELKTEMSGEVEGNENEVELNENGELESNEKRKVEGNENEEIKANEHSEVQANENSVVLGNENEEIKANENSEVEGNENGRELNEENKVKGTYDQDERVKRADSVIAKVISSKIFLLNTKTGKKNARNNKTCQVCSKSFDRVGDLKRHLIEHIVKSTLAKVVSSKHGILNITCEICQTESFYTVDKYKAHLREHAKLTLYKCTFCDKSFSDSSNFSKHKKIHGVSYFQCDLCRRRFNSKIMIAKHLELHTNNKPMKCKQCHRIFHFESMLNKHIKSVHNKPADSKFLCRFCGEGFKTLKDKWDHEWLVHHIRKAIVDCRICGAKFRKYFELKRHCLQDHDMDIPTQKKLLSRNVYLQ